MISADASFLDEYRRLKSWLLEYAYPLWWTYGADREAGGFHERLTLDATPTGEARRARLQPRQVYAFASARELGWDGPSEAAARHGLAFFFAHHYRSDGLIRTLVDANGNPLDETAVLYDHAFALLGLAAAFALLREEDCRLAARALQKEIVAAFAHIRGFDERLDQSAPLLANSHMHLLEACLAWHELDRNGWHPMAQGIVDLALENFMDPRTHLITEFFERDWTPAAGDRGRIVEPGHQFEWAWLLLRWSQLDQRDDIAVTALNLIDAAERSVHTQRRVAMNQLALHHDGLIVRDANARLWPQTERIKALLGAARLTRDARYIDKATQALQALRKYFEVDIAGLWHDTMQTDGTFAIESAPASSFYHIVCTAQECERYISSNS